MAKDRAIQVKASEVVVTASAGFIHQTDPPKIRAVPLTITTTWKAIARSMRTRRRGRNSTGPLLMRGEPAQAPTSAWSGIGASSPRRDEAIVVGRAFMP